MQVTDEGASVAALEAFDLSEAGLDKSRQQLGEEAGCELSVLGGNEVKDARINFEFVRQVRHNLDQVLD